MKIMHLSDLHLGKSIYGISLIESGDQETLVKSILNAVNEHKPDAVIIAGDVYDRSNPSEDAVVLFEELLNGLMELGTPAFIVSGNHDSAKRLSYLNATLKNHNIHIADELSETLEQVTLEDEHGEVVFRLMPYAYPALISQVLDDPELKYKDYNTAVKALLERQNIDYSKRNVLIAHQFVTQNGKEAERGGSETSVAGVGAIEADTFADIEYTALGHIHAGYKVGGNVRYCGTPMCYHFDETRQKDKGALLIEIDAKGEDIKVDKITFAPLHPLVIIKGPYEEVKRRISDLKGGEYVSVTVTDKGREERVNAAITSLLSAKDAKMLEFTQANTYRANLPDSEGSLQAEKPVAELFDDFYFERMKEHLDGDDSALILYLAEITERTNFEEDGAADRAAAELLDFLKEG